MKCQYCKQPARLMVVKSNGYLSTYRITFCKLCLRWSGNRRDTGKGQKANLERRDEFFKQGVLRATYFGYGYPSTVLSRLDLFVNMDVNC